MSFPQGGKKVAITANQAGGELLGGAKKRQTIGSLVDSAGKVLNAGKESNPHAKEREGKSGGLKGLRSELQEKRSSGG